MSHRLVSMAVTPILVAAVHTYQTPKRSLMISEASDEILGVLQGMYSDRAEVDGLPAAAGRMRRSWACIGQILLVSCGSLIMRSDKIEVHLPQSQDYASLLSHTEAVQIILAIADILVEAVEEVLLLRRCLLGLLVNQLMTLMNVMSHVKSRWREIEL